MINAKKAVIADKAPKDIYSSDDPKVYPLGDAGISVVDLNAKQVKGLNQLIDVYLNNMPSKVAKERRVKFEKDGMDQVVFAWAEVPKWVKLIIIGYKAPASSLSTTIFKIKPITSMPPGAILMATLVAISYGNTTSTATGISNSFLESSSEG